MATSCASYTVFLLFTCKFRKCPFKTPANSLTCHFFRIEQKQFPMQFQENLLLYLLLDQFYDNGIIRPALISLKIGYLRKPLISMKYILYLYHYQVYQRTPHYIVNMSLVYTRPMLPYEL